MVNKLFLFTLKTFRKFYAKVFKVQALTKPDCEQDSERVSETIYNKLMADEPCMIARFGSTELTAIVNYLGVKEAKKDYFGYIQNQALPWWWNESIMQQMQEWSGFFPPTAEKVTQFCELMLEDMKDLDVLGSWLSDEQFVLPYTQNIQLVSRGKFDPFWTKKPWTKALSGKKVLVIHPFSAQIHSQYLRKEKLFRDPEFLPDFELKVLPAVQSLGGSDHFKDWFDALDSMKRQMTTIDFDVVLIGAGAYGFPLAAHAKRMKKKAIHIGGSLQLFFGIIGKRWEYEPKIHGTDYPGLINEYWVRPENNLKPANFSEVEGGCYW